MKPARSVAAWCAIAMLPLAAVAASSARQDLAQALRSTPDPAHGRERFEACAACHGATGEGGPDGNVPAIAGQHYEVIVKQLVDYRHGRRWDVRMERIADRHHLASAQDIADVAAFASGLERRAPLGVGSGEWVNRGASVYFRLCASCHGTLGQGDARRHVPQLAGQHYEYLLRQLYDTVEGRRPNILRTHTRLLKGLVYEDYVGIADYLSRLIPPARDRSGEPAAPAADSR